MKSNQIIELCKSSIKKHQNVSQHYLLEGIQLLELARNAYSLFIQQVPTEKRRLLQFLVSNSSWAHQELQVELRQPFDLIMKLTEQIQDTEEFNIEESATFEKWLPLVSIFRTQRREEVLNFGQCFSEFKYDKVRIVC